MRWPAACPAPVPEGYETLPNPRHFTPVALEPIDYHPDPATLTVPDNAADWPRDEPFTLRIAMPDGVHLAARSQLPDTAHPPLVILLHMWGMDKESWERRAPGFLQTLCDAGIATCALDLRWHGASGGEEHCAVYADWMAARQLPAAERQEEESRLFRMAPPMGANIRFLPDLAAVMHYFRKSGRIDPARIGIIGASVGANCTWVASALYDARVHVVISPYYPAPGWSLMGREVDPFVPRDCLFIADREEAPEARRMAERTSGLVETLSFDDLTEHGIGLLRQPHAQGRVLGILRETFALQ